MEEDAVPFSPGWPLVLLDEIASRGSGHTPSKRHPEYWNGTVDWVSLADTTKLDKGLVTSSASTITHEGVAHSSAVIHAAGTVILLRGSSVGKSGVLASDMAVSQDYVTWTCGPQLDNWYLYYFLQSRKNEFARIGFGNTIKTIGLDYFENFKIPLPLIAEQQGVAQALWSCDSLISSLEKSIVKKQAVNQGMAQQLLAGRTRLPGFSHPWSTAEVGKLLEFKNGLNKSCEYFGLGTPIVNFMDVINGPIIRTADVMGRVTLTREEIKRFSARRNDLFFTRTSETIDEVATAAVLADDIEDATFSGFILRGRVRSDDIDSRFLAHLFQLAPVRKQITSAATYTTRALTNGKTLSQILVEIPPLGEQRAIADLIADADNEIAMLWARLDKARAIKQGMMQQLLTGRTRLPV